VAFDYTKIIEWIKLSPKYLIGIAIFCGLLIFIPSDLLEYFSLKDIVSAIKPYLSLAFFGTVALLFAGFLSFLGEIFLIRFKAFTYRSRFKDLTPEEKDILKSYIENEVRSQKFNIMNGTIQGLVADDILFRSTSLGTGDGYFSFKIQPWAWRYLKKNKHILE